MAILPELRPLDASGPVEARQPDREGPDLRGASLPASVSAVFGAEKGGGRGG